MDMTLTPILSRDLAVKPALYTPTACSSLALPPTSPILSTARPLAPPATSLVSSVILFIWIKLETVCPLEWMRVLKCLSFHVLFYLCLSSVDPFSFSVISSFIFILCVYESASFAAHELNEFRILSNFAATKIVLDFLVIHVNDK